MSQQDNFSGGFLLGAIVGGIAGGVLGALLTAQRLNDEGTEVALPEGKKPTRARRRSLKGGTPEQNIELARRSLEDKIAQLNDAIDDVRQQLGNVNGRAMEMEQERSVPED